ncbi:hypothetical protein ElyMa_000765900 [Elysia marginata]|uniref:Fibronectin type-III domain-containing protein n=1 Tax=Elysia marginata TaxID=1093978 RepID=A0AAV4GT22_9GAST|nr:hypothetical protein ElyMa_000765900 [Elysia marginata]
MLTATPKTEACWRAARPCAEPELSADAGVSCLAWYRCENEGDYVIKWRCETTEQSGKEAENVSVFSLCVDQSELGSSFENCPPPVVCADDPKQEAQVIMPQPGYLSIDIILVIAVVSFAVIAILLTIASSYKYWSLRRRFQFPVRPGQYVLRDFPYPVRYHNLWGTRYSPSNYTMDTTKPPFSTLSGDFRMLFPEVNRSRMNRMSVNGFKSHSKQFDVVSKPFYPDVYFSKHSSETVAVSGSPGTYHTVSGYPSKQGGKQGVSGRKRCKDTGTITTATAAGSFASAWRDAWQGKDETETGGRDISEVAGSFVYHDPRGGTNPSWRVIGKSGLLAGHGKGRGNIGKTRDIGTKNRLESDDSSLETGMEKGKGKEFGTCKVRGDRVGEYWLQCMAAGQSHRTGDTQSQLSEERIQIYRGNLNTPDVHRTKPYSKAYGGAYSAVSGAAGGGAFHTDLINPSHATPPDARVSSIAIPQHDTLPRDMSAGKTGIRFSNTEMYSTKGHKEKESPLTLPPMTCVHPQSNLYTDLLDFSDRKEHSREEKIFGQSGNKEWNVYRPYSVGLNAKACDTVDIGGQHIHKRSNKYKTKGSTRKNKWGPDKDSRRYLRVRGAIYRIVPTVTGGNSSSSTSSNSLGSDVYCTESGLAQSSHRVADHDLSYDNFRDNHLRQLARRGGRVASSSTLDACAARDCAEHSSSSSSDRDYSRF